MIEATKKLLQSYLDRSEEPSPLLAQLQEGRIAFVEGKWSEWNEQRTKPDGEEPSKESEPSDGLRRSDDEGSGEAE